ncbi:hypothetical protein [Arenivirga flava]|uniref:Uncharacterized protein n=1 Tax=Arenivirga flava TaxID=1930060 RepID=A0AA37UL39_9MICO|nr:hypothetical protein [Arenivirga flava]GMA29678.1 hypothetical protein GCM10025874_29310 [Arenivirga flava]
MGFLDRLLGREEQPPQQPQYARQGWQQQSAPQQPAQRSDDEIAIERYRYLLRTAPPEQLEQVHAEAFDKLTPEQRQQVYADIAANGEQPQSDSPQDLARSATRAEVRQPGFMERSFGNQQGRQGPGFGSMLGASILGTVAGYVIGSTIMSAFLPPMDGGADTAGGEDAGGDAGAETDLASDGGDAGGFGDFGGGDFGGFGEF